MRPPTHSFRTSPNTRARTLTMAFLCGSIAKTRKITQTLEGHTFVLFGPQASGPLELSADGRLRRQHGRRTWTERQRRGDRT